MKSIVTILSALALTGAVASPALADVDFDDLRVRDNGSSLTVRGVIEGLEDDDGDVIIALRARGDVEYRCERRGESRRYEDEIRLRGRDEIREWRVDAEVPFNITTRRARERDLDAPRCRDLDVRDVAFTRFRLLVRQGGDLLATRTCWFDEPTRDGRIEDRDVDCADTRDWDDRDDWGDWDDDREDDDDWGEEAPAAPVERAGQ